MALQPATIDAFVLVPGILGSELRDASDEPVWGLGPKALARALVTGSVYERLQDPTLTVGDLLKVPASLPGFDRFEPYTELVSTLEGLARAGDAVLVYPYDWRRPIADVAAELAVDAAQHLDRWRTHPQGSRDSQLVLVGHSMGGLISRLAAEMHRDQLPLADMRMVLTLGTPFGGSVKAVRAVSTGEVMPASWLIPRRVKERLRGLAVATPSVHDLLPSYPCLGGSGDEARRPRVEDLTAIGAAPELAGRAAETRGELEATLREPSHASVPLHALVGESQPTLQSFAVTDGEVSFVDSVDGVNWGGDGTVHFGAAYPRGGEAGAGLPQKHGALAKSPEARSFVRTKILGGRLGPRQGDAIGLHVNEAAERGEAFHVEVISPRGAEPTCTWREPATGLSGRIDLPRPDQVTIGGSPMERRVADHAFSHPGLYTIDLAGGGVSPVRADVLILDPS